ncbi:MAG: T9SS type A sorting domain-containing protein [Prevotellaceae bacterium]|jgi:hypothetical protein|nr:T9SS type A sorting domain-containing protein [Prevotellaceae bacterium]
MKKAFYIGMLVILTFFVSVVFALPVEEVEGSNDTVYIDEQVEGRYVKAGVILYPNPVQADLNIYSEEKSIEQIEIYSNKGELVFSSPMIVPSGARITINMGSHPTGYYLVKIYFKGVKQAQVYRIYKN